MKPFLYFDYAATTPCCEPAAEVLFKYATEDFANPSSGHLLGQIAAQGVRDARAFFAGTFRTSAECVVFTSGGTEANNLVIQGAATKILNDKSSAGAEKKMHLLYSAVEHPAVRECAERLRELGFEPEEIPVDCDGKIQESELVKRIRPTTFLISIHQVNNILGTLYPIEALARAAKQVQPDVLFHTDAIQAFGKVGHPTFGSPVDFVSLSGHKIEGPKGVGAVIAIGKHGFAPLRPILFGGGQEFGMRSGTVSPGLVAAFKVAAELNILHREKSFLAVRQLRNQLEAGLKARGLLRNETTPDAILGWNSPKDGVPHIVHLSVHSLPAALVTKQLEERRCFISSGSACSSGKTGPDQVLLKTGRSKELCQSGLRISFSSKTSTTDVEQLIDALTDSLQTVSVTLTGKKISTTPENQSSKTREKEVFRSDL